MNCMKTAILLAGMTALFLAIGYAIGGQGGMLLALVFSIGTNLFAYWNSDKMVLRMHGAMPASESQFPELTTRWCTGWRTMPACRCPRST